MNKHDLEFIALVALGMAIWLGTMIATGWLVRRGTGWSPGASAVIGILLGTVPAYGVCSQTLLRL